MKKFWKSLALLLCLLAGFGFVFTACGNGDDDDNNGNPVAVTGVTLNKTELSLTVGETENLTATVEPANATNKNVTWSSSDTEVASVENGTVTAKKSGTATITVTTEDAGKEATATVTVEKEISGIYTIEGKTYTLYDDGEVTDEDGNAVGSTTNGTVTITDSEGNTLYTAETDEKGAIKTDSVKKGSETVAVTEIGITLQKNSEASKKYATIKKALAAIPDTATEADTYTISLDPNTYSEDALSYTKKANLVILGNADAEYGNDVIISGKGSAQTDSVSRCLFYTNTAATVTFKNVTLKSTFTRAGTADNKTQCEVLGTGNGSGKTVAYNSSFLSHQDTVRTVGKAWFYKCYFEGDVDFLWMETAGVVALYEDCEIKMVGDETTAAYVAAPGLSQTSPVGKGLVIYNSKVIVDSDSTSKLGASAYLARTPWTEGKYNQVAYINTTFEGTVNSNVWYGSAIATDFDKTDIGWKMDSTTAENLGYEGKDDILTDRMAKREYNGRYVILNRVYNTSTGKYQTASNLWDVDSEFSFGQPTDSSKNNIFLDYADVSKTSVGDELAVSDYTATVPSVTWSAKAYGKYDESTGEFTEEKSDIKVNFTDAGITSTESKENIYVKVTATKGTGDTAISDYLVLYSLTVTGFTIDNKDETISIAQGSEKQINVKFEPTGATADVTWESDKTSAGVTVENGLIKVATNAAAGTKATITAKVTIGEQVVSKSLTVEVTAGAKLSKFGASVAGVDYSEGYGTIGKGEYLVYPVALDLASTSADYKMSLEAKFTYTATRDETKSTNGYGAPQIGVGIIAFKDGAYSGGVYSQEEVATFAGVKGTSGSSWDGTVPSYQPNTVYTMTVTVTKGGNVSFSLTDGTDTATKSSAYSGWFKKMPFNDIVYIGIGGESSKGNASVDISSIKIVDGTKEYGVSALEDAGEDTRATLSGSPTASITLTSENSQNGKGEDENITLMNSTSGDVVLAFANTTISPSVEGTWVWDADSAKSTKGGNVTAKASFFPTSLEDRLTHKAILNQDVTITVTDNRATASATAAKITGLTSGLTGDDALSNAMKVSVSGNNELLTVYTTGQTTGEAQFTHSYGTDNSSSTVTLTGNTGEYTKNKLSANCPMFTSVATKFKFSTGTPMSTLSFDVKAGANKVTLKSISLKSAQSASSGNGALYIQVGNATAIKLAESANNVASVTSFALTNCTIDANATVTIKLFIAGKAGIEKTSDTAVKFEYADLEISADVSE